MKALDHVMRARALRPLAGPEVPCDDVTGLFLRRSLEEADAIRTALQFAQRPENAVQAGKVRFWAHRVRGTAAFLGLEDISARGLEIERLALSPLHEDSSEVQALCDAIDALVLGLELRRASCG